jgi:hypothetical protein
MFLHRPYLIYYTAEKRLRMPIDGACHNSMAHAQDK